jgi:hypothetical protein
MRIAVVESDPLYVKLLRKRIKSELAKWEIDYFESSTEFGKAKLSQYHIIVADYKLLEISGLALLKSVSKKTSASLAIMCEHDIFEKDNLKEKIGGSISAIFDKRNLTKIIDWFHYTEVKIRIAEVIESEAESLANIANVAIETNKQISAKNDGAMLIFVYQNLLKQKAKRD